MAEIKKKDYEKLLKKAKRLFEKAQKEKNKSKDLLSECLELSFPSNGTLQEAMSKDNSLEDKTISQYDDTVKIASRRMVNYIADTLTPAGQIWANFAVNIEVDQNEETDSGEENESKEVRTVGDIITDSVFKEINESNAHNSLYQSYENLVGAGTGAVKLLEMPRFSQKATQTKNLPMDKLFYLEDTYEFPEFVMYKHVDETIDVLYDLFGKNRVRLDEDMKSTPADELELKEFTFIEGCILLEHKRLENEYLHFMADENFQHFYFTEIMDYNPFIVYRWAKPSDNQVWGIPIALSTIANIRTLNESVEIEMKKARLMLRPPMAAMIDPSYMTFMDTESLSSQVNYKEGEITIINGMSQLFPIVTSYDMQMSAVSSDQIRNTIYSLYNVNPLGDVQNTRYRTAEEMALRHQEFSRQFAPTYGRLTNEFMERYLRTMLKILKKRNRIPLTKDQIRIAQEGKIEFINPLTKLAAQEKIQNAINFKMMMSKVINPEVFTFVFDDIEFVYDAAKELNIPAKTMNDKKDVIEGMKRQQQQQRQAMEMMMRQGVNPQQGQPQQGGDVNG